MPTTLAAPLVIEEFAHADSDLVEYVLDERTRRIYVQPVGSTCQVASSGTEGIPISDPGVLIADGGLEPFRLQSADNPARRAGRSVFIATGAAATVKILSDRG